MGGFQEEAGLASIRESLGIVNLAYVQGVG